MKYCLGNFRLHGKPVICGRNIHNFDSCYQIGCFPIKPMTTHTTTCNITHMHTSLTPSLVFSCVASGFCITLQKASSLCPQYEILKIFDGSIFEENHELMSLFLHGTTM